MSPTRNHWGFVIDTNKYAGNFEREMCAYLTGEVGECGVGDDCIVIPPINFNNNILSIADEHGCFRPAATFPNPNYLNNGMGFVYKPGQEEEEALTKLRESYLEQAENSKKMYSHIPDYAEKEFKRWEKQAKRAIEPGKFEAFNSVIIYFSSKPSQDQIDYMKRQAISYADENDIVVEGFRLLQFQSNTIKHTC